MFQLARENWNFSKVLKIVFEKLSTVWFVVICSFHCKIFEDYDQVFFQRERSCLSINNFFSNCLFAIQFIYMRKKYSR